MLDTFISVIVANGVASAFFGIVLYNVIRKTVNRIDDMEDRQTALIEGLHKALNGNFAAAYESRLHEAREHRDRLNKGLKF